MSYRYAVIAAGRQGTALAYDLARTCDAQQVVLADVDGDVARRAVTRLGELLPDSVCRFEARTCDIRRPAELNQAVAGADVVLSAAPYRYNIQITDAALAAGASFCDLGGNTDVVRQQMARHEEAQRRGVSVVPDCGLAPGLCNLLAAHGVAAMDEPEHVHLRCGGLPQEPVGPLGYQMTFNFDGLINEYSGHAEFLRGGRPAAVPALSELEAIDFPPPLGHCEAAVTSGATSTAPETFAGRLQSYDYKTVRYPGHFAIIRALFALGCFEPEVTLEDGRTLAPRPILRQLFEDRLRLPHVRDCIVLRCTVIGRHESRPQTIQYDLYDRHDERTGFTAMERATAFPTALVAYMQARKLIAPGAHPLEVCVPVDRYLTELGDHDIRVTVSRS
ncbi:MAG: saccharopine dehydrogenase C-terminal domain-containing protein [Phycisphaerae bacterium]